MRVMAYPRYAALGASSRVRWLQWCAVRKEYGKSDAFNWRRDDHHLYFLPLLGGQSVRLFAMRG